MKVNTKGQPDCSLQSEAAQDFANKLAELRCIISAAKAMFPDSPGKDNGSLKGLGEVFARLNLAGEELARQFEQLAVSGSNWVSFQDYFQYVGGYCKTCQFELETAQYRARSVSPKGENTPSLRLTN